MEKICKICKSKFESISNRKILCDKCQEEKRRIYINNYMKKYMAEKIRKTERYKQYQKEYQKEYRKLNNRKYNQLQC